jgi:hypothetical protein
MLRIGFTLPFRQAPVRGPERPLRASRWQDPEPVEGHTPSLKKRPRPPCGGRGPKTGGGSSPRSLSRSSTFGALIFRGCRFPDAIPCGWQDCRPHSRAVRTVARHRLSGEASRLGSAPACRQVARQTGSRHACKVRSARLDRFPQGRLPLLGGRWPCATGLTSYPSDCFCFTVERRLFRCPS